jgi:hypothetical protein
LLNHYTNTPLFNKNVQHIDDVKKLIFHLFVFIVTDF